MFDRKLPRCACISVLSKVTVPTTIGTIVTLALKIPDIIKAANAVNDGINAAKQFANDLDNQFQQNKNTREEVIDMG